MKLYKPERGSIQVRAAVDLADLCVTSTLAQVEVLGALARAQRGRLIARDEAARGRQQVLADLGSMTLVRTVDELVDHATQLAERHYLRAYDAVHLASALAVRAYADVTFTAFDRALLEAARVEGLSVLATG